MRKFREYLTEVARTRSRAQKLLNYVYKKKKFGPEPEVMRNTLHPSSLYADLYDQKTNGQPISDTHFANSPILKIPVKKIVSNQDFVLRNVLAKKIQGKWKDHDPEHVQLVHKDGQYHVLDGNHRVNAARFLGRKHIKAQVVNADSLNEITGKGRLASLELKASRDEISPSIKDVRQKKIASLKALQAHYLMQRMRGEKKNPYDEVPNLWKAAQMAKAKKRLRLTEVQRTPQRAAKLANYIANRIQKKTGSRFKELYTTGDRENTRANADEMDRVLKGNEKTKYMMPVSRVHKKNLEAAKEIDQETAGLEVTQHSVDLDGVLHKIAMGDDQPITAIKHGHNKYVVDGHHRFVKARLLGTPVNTKILSLRKANQK